MKLYVCYGTFPVGFKRHPCRDAHEALLAAGHKPEVVKTYGFGAFPEFMNPGRKPVRKLTGKDWVPALELDDGNGIAGTAEIIAWAKANPKV